MKTMKTICAIYFMIQFIETIHSYESTLQVTETSFHFSGLTLV